MEIKYLGAGLRYLRNLARISFSEEPILDKTVLAKDPTILGKSTVYGVDIDGNYWRVPDRNSRLIRSKETRPLSYPSMQGHVNIGYYTGTLLEWRPVRSKRVPQEVKDTFNHPDHRDGCYIKAADPCIAIF